LRDARLAEKAFRLAASSRRDTTTMPFTVGYLQSLCKAMGHRVGEHRAAKMIHHLERRRILVKAGHYKSRAHGFRVTLYLVPRLTVSVRRRKPVKRLNERLTWWLHPLFGNPDGEPPPGRRKR
jgi:hypothetical protein